MIINSFYLKPNELLIIKKPSVVYTILGSCISVTMFHRRTKIGAICHAMLPKSINNKEKDRFSYVDKSLMFMIRRLKELGIEKDEIEVKLFGGGNVLSVKDTRSNIAYKNVEAAFEIINRENLNLISYDVKGNKGRKLIFRTDTGEVLIKKVNIRDLCIEKMEPLIK